MTTAPNTTMKVDLPPMKLETIKLCVIGDSELIVHAWSEKAKKEMLDKQLKRPKSAKEAKNPEAEFLACLYRLDDGGYGFPSVAFKSAAVTAVTSVGGMTKVLARQTFHVMGEEATCTGVFTGDVALSQMRLDLVRILGSEPVMREDMVKIALGTADIRYRPQFWPWHAIPVIRFNSSVISAGQVAQLFDAAGFGVGIGEWRSERDGQSGLFHVATQPELDALGIGNQGILAKA